MSGILERIEQKLDLIIGMLSGRAHTTEVDALEPPQQPAQEQPQPLPQQPAQEQAPPQQDPQDRTPVSTTPQPQQEAGQSDRVQLTGGEMTHEFAVRALRVRWNRPGGDWLDANKTMHGNEPFATARISQYGEQEIVLDVTDAVRAIAAGVADGLVIMRVAGAGWIHVASMEHQSIAGPRLDIALDEGDVHVVLNPLYDTWLSHTSANPLDKRPDLQFPMMMSFGGLSGLAGIKSASLRMRTYNQGSLPVTIGAFLLLAPKIEDDPRADLDLSQWREEWRCDRYESAEQMIAAGWWPEASVKRDARIFNQDGSLTLMLAANTQTAASFRKRVVFTPERYANGVNPAPTEIMVSFDLEVGLDAGDVDGVKLPGVHGMFENGPFPSGMQNLSAYGFSLRTEHTRADPANPNHLGHFTYYYLPGMSGSGSGGIWDTEKFLLRKGKRYTFTQHVRLNSFAQDGVPVPDGLYRLYVNGALRCDRQNVLLRTDPRVTIEDWLWVNIFHGGRSPATHNAHYTLGKVVVYTPNRDNASSDSAPRVIDTSSQPQQTQSTTSPSTSVSQLAEAMSWKPVRDGSGQIINWQSIEKNCWVEVDDRDSIFGVFATREMERIGWTPPNYRNHVYSAINAFCGHPQRDHFVVVGAGGGHRDGAMNGFFSLDLRSLRWRMEIEPTPLSKMPDGYLEKSPAFTAVKYPNGMTYDWFPSFETPAGDDLPASRHTYNGVCLTPDLEYVHTFVEKLSIPGWSNYIHITDIATSISYRWPHVDPSAARNSMSTYGQWDFWRDGKVYSFRADPGGWPVRIVFDLARDRTRSVFAEKEQGVHAGAYAMIGDKYVFALRCRTYAESGRTLLEIRYATLYDIEDERVIYDKEIEPIGPYQNSGEGMALVWVPEKSRMLFLPCRRRIDGSVDNRCFWVNPDNGQYELANLGGIQPNAGTQWYSRIYPVPGTDVFVAIPKGESNLYALRF